MSLFAKIFGSQRTSDMKSLAYRLGMKFYGNDDYGLRKQLGAFQLFKTGHSRKIKNLMVMDDGNLQSRYAVFDYFYTIQTGKSSVTYAQTVFFMDSKQLGLPQFIIKPEHFFHRIGKALGLVKDIEFEDHPEFSSQFLIQSEFPEMVKDLVSEEVMRMMTIEKKWTLEGINYLVILYRRHKKLKLNEIESFHELGKSIVAGLQEGKDV